MIVNSDICAQEARLIGRDGEQLGIKSKHGALQLAEEADLGLVLVAPRARPAVARITDYRKYRFEIQRKEREARKKQKTITVKEICLSPSIDTNDSNVKLKRVRRFIEKGDKVRISLQLCGCVITHKNISRDMIKRMAKEASDITIVVRRPEVEGWSIFLTLAPAADKAKS